MIYLIRHAQKENSLSDCGLSAKGFLEAKQYAEKLIQNKIKLDYIISSPIKRCLETANEIALMYGKDVVISKYLGDPGVFILDDKLAMNVFREYKLIDIINMQLLGKNLYGFESLEIGSLKLLNFMKSYKDSNVLMVSHDAIIMPFICYFSDMKEITQKDIIGYLEGYQILLKSNVKIKKIEFIKRTV